MKPKKTKKRMGGSAWMKKEGLTAVMIGFTAEDLAIIDEACEIEKRSRANFVAHYAVEATKAAARAIVDRAAQAD
jgi:hypothetical protein